MKKFVFRLEKLLGYRRHQETSALRDFLESKAEQRQIAAECKRLAEQRQAVLQECGEAARQGISVARYQLYAVCSDALAMDLEESSTRLNACEEAVQVRHQRLKTARIGRQSLENLKDQQQRRHSLDAALEAQKRLDEMVVMRWEKHGGPS